MAVAWPAQQMPAPTMPIYHHIEPNSYASQNDPPDYMRPQKNGGSDLYIHKSATTFAMHRRATTLAAHKRTTTLAASALLDEPWLTDPPFVEVQSAAPAVPLPTSKPFHDPYVHNKTRSTRSGTTESTSTESSSTEDSDHSDDDDDDEQTQQCERSMNPEMGSMMGMNLLFSFFLFCIGMLVFAFVSRSARKTERKNLIERRDSTGSDWIRHFYTQRLVEEAKLPSSRTSSESNSDVVNETGTELGFFLPVFWYWKTEELERRVGKSATQYLRFIEYLIAYASIVVVFSTLFILPINLQGKLISDKTDFGRQTLVNIDPKSSILWLHVTFSLLLFPMALFFATRFVKHFRGYNRLDRSSKTLMITNTDPDEISAQKVVEHFDEGYPDVNPTRVNLTFHTQKLQKLDKELQLCIPCLKFYEKTLRPGSETPIYSNDNLCTRCCCCCCDTGVDAVGYYSSRATELENQIESVIDQPKMVNRTFFVSFETDEMAKKVHKAYRLFIVSIFSKTTSVSKELRSKFWSAKYAPYPELVKWQNLESGGWKWWTRAILLNLGLFLLLFFITSPVLILNALGVTSLAQNVVFVNQIIPALFLVEIGFITGALMKFVTNKTRYHDKIRELLVTMKGAYAYTLVAQLILPTFGLTSAKALYNYVVSSATGEDFDWSCLFLPDYGLVFVTFFTFQSLFGTSLVFTRVFELQVLAARRCAARSKAEQWLLSQRKTPFAFTAGYARNLVIFCITVVYGFVVPFVAPLGLFTLIMNHIAERYSIFFVNRRQEAPNAVHRSAINLFLLSVLLQLILMIFFTGVRAGSVGMGTMVIAVILYGIILVYVSFREQFGKFHRIHHTAIGSKFLVHVEEDDDEDSVDPLTETNEYEAPILRRYEMLRPLTHRRHSEARSKSPSWED